MGFETSKELFINMKNPPLYDPRKSYYDQSREVIQFYDEEMKKITKGVKIGGFFVHPWLYFHLNFFKTPIPIRDNDGNDIEMLMNPPLDDNMFYVTESYQEAKERNKILFLFGTRGFSKSVLISSLTNWTTVSRPNGKFSIMGSSAPDLKSISSLMETSFGNIHPAFYLPTLKKDWNSYVEFGVKEKTGHRLTHSEIFVTNFDKGSKKESEKGAGLSPVGFVLDEAGKSDCIEVLESAIPSFKTQYGFKLVPVLAGTGGNNVLSKDAKKLLTNPDAYDILPMNWDRLNRIVPEEFITWKEDTKSKFGTFVPGQMTYREAIPRVEKTFSEFLGVKNKDLDKIKIQTTNWKVANKVLENMIDKNKVAEEGSKNRAYYPRRITDCFLTQSKNPFPTTLIEKRIRFLEEEALLGKDIEIYKEGSKTVSEFSDKKRAEVSHPGGNVDAPIILFGELPETPPERYIYAAGLDDYKLDTSDTDSLGAFYIIKRRNLEANQPCETIVASFTSRPDRHLDFHITCETLIEAWNSECLIEAVDVSFKQYLELRGNVEKMLAPAITFSNKSDRSRLTTSYGMYPTIGNNEYRLNLTIDTMKERFTIGIDSDTGAEIVKYGVDYVDDIDLLKEMLNYKKGGNFDRLTAYSHALVLAREWDKNNVRPKMQKSASILDTYDAKKKTNKKIMTAYTDTSKFKKW